MGFDASFYQQTRCLLYFHNPELRLLRKFVKNVLERLIVDSWKTPIF